MQRPVHAWARETSLKCKLCGVSQIFFGEDLDERERWKDLHFKDGKPVCIGQYKPHVRDALAPIVATGQTYIPANTQEPQLLRFENLDRPEQQTIRDIEKAQRNLARLFCVPERLIHPRITQRYEYSSLGDDSDWVNVDIREVYLPERCSTEIRFCITQRNGIKRDWHYLFTNERRNCGNPNYLWRDLCECFRSSAMRDIDDVPFSPQARNFLETFRHRLRVV